MSDAAAESQAADPSRRDHTGGNHEAGRRGCCVDLAEPRSALDLQCGCSASTLTAFIGERSRRALIEGSEPSAVVPLDRIASLSARSRANLIAAAISRPSKGETIPCGMPVDHRVVESARLVIAGTPLLDGPSADHAREPINPRALPSPSLPRSRLLPKSTIPHARWTQWPHGGAPRSRPVTPEVTGSSPVAPTFRTLQKRRPQRTLSAVKVADVQYAKSGDVNIAYQVKVALGERGHEPGCPRLPAGRR